MKIIINGSNGRIGKAITPLLKEEFKGASLAAAIDRNNTAFDKAPLFKDLDSFKGEADCIIDFSNHLATDSLVKYAVKRNIPLVIATTGQTQEELEIIKEASKEIAIFLAANMSLGIAILVELAKLTVKIMPQADVEIIEKHHNRKLDSPSGTALFIADEIKSVNNKAKYIFGRNGKVKRDKDEIGIHSLRFGNLVGEHEVIVSTDTETIILKHQAHNKELFAEGSIIAAGFLKDKPAGLYGMKDLIG